MNGRGEAEQNRPKRLLAIILAVFAVVVWSDVCIWDVPAGAGYAGIWLALGSAVVLFGPRPSPRGWVLLGLMAGAAAATALELSFSNVVAVLLLLGLLTAATFFREWPGGLPRAFEVGWAWIKAPVRWLVLVNEVLVSVLEKRGGVFGGVAKIVRMAWVTIPGLILAGIFLLLLSSGNLVLGRGLDAMVDSFWSWLMKLELSFGRVFFWGFMGTVALALIYPSLPEKHGRWWWGLVSTWELPVNEKNGRLRSIIALALVNGVFLLTNTIDAAYLWFGHGLPEGVTYSDYLHAGVYQLILATLLAGAVLAALCQQPEPVRCHPWVRGLALAWIVQNAILVAGVFMRLKLYVDAYLLTQDRVYVAAFLCLVLAGYGFLVLRVLNRIGLLDLFRLNMAAVCVLFYLVQFCDVPRWVTDSNVTHWLKDRQAKLDLPYLDRLGSASYEGLIRVADSDSDKSRQAREILERKISSELPVKTKDWRSTQLWHDRQMRALQEYQTRRVASAASN